MHRFLYVLFILGMHSCLFASELIRYPKANVSLQERQKWAFQNAADKKTFWVGYSIMRWMDPNQYFISGVTINGSVRFDKGRSVEEWIYGTKTERVKDEKEAARLALEGSDKKRQKVWREMGIFQKFHRGSKIPQESQIMNLTISTQFDAPMYWLGKSTHEESFAYLSGIYSQISSPGQKEDVMSAIGIHPAQMAFPFLKKVLTSNEPEGAQEAAAVHMGDLDTPEALETLKHVVYSNANENVREAAVVGIAEIQSENAFKIICDIARSHRDPDLRETAMAMLGDKKEPAAVKVLEEVAWFDPDEDMRETAVAMLGESAAGVPILLKIMEEHPSKETRETAVHFLAESVVGREVLKKKIKQ